MCNNRPSQQDIETFLIADEQNGHYIWMNQGWQKGRSHYRYHYVRSDSRW
ncbi:element excision factor XisI family protein [Microcoleus sp. S13_B4]